MPSYRSLLLTNRAVWRRNSVVWYTTAGTSPVTNRLRCATSTDAKRVGGSLLMELRKANSDEDYNSIMARFLREIADAWPEQNTQIKHVHQCDRGNSGERCVPDAAGKTPCGFDWSMHRLDDSGECLCGPELDADSDLIGRLRFVVHKDYEKKEMVIL